MTRAVSTGAPSPLGATAGLSGVNFALFSEHADSVRLCLFESPESGFPSEVLPLRGPTNGVFHAHVAGIRPGQIYGYRVDGPWSPESGHRFDSSKVLLDPYARAVARHPQWDASVYLYSAEKHPDPDRLDQVQNRLDSGRCSSLGIVVGSGSGPGRDSRPRTSWRDTVIYELQVKGFTRLHPDVPPAQRGTYAGLASEAVIAYLLRLGVTAVELLPVQHHVTEHRLERLDLANYWGYQPLAFFAPEPAYSMTRGMEALTEFRDMVRRFHVSGIEVILDVVFNHTCEMGHDGPTLSFRGIDNAVYYRLDPSDKRRYVDYSGCGNSLNTQHPAVVRLVMDCLRYWVEEMGVDGFRFDLATSLGRTERDFDRWAPLLTAMGQDPVLQGIKLIAEPWDVNARDSYQLGNFPAGWAEWNGRFRDDARRYWRGDAGLVPRFASRISGSSDIFGKARRAPQASVNFIASHDGFTLMDLVSYERKRNAANGEDGRDGETRNHSWNCGLEGPTDDPGVGELRGRQRRNLLATLLLSQGVPMLAAGDEFGRTQRGNNNAYCQDNDTSWVDWQLAEGSPLAEFVRSLVQLRQSESAFRRASFFNGALDPVLGARDVTWLRRDGSEISRDDWLDKDLSAFAVMLVAGEARRHLLLFNPSERTCEFALPAGSWTVRMDTRYVTFPKPAKVVSRHAVLDRSLVLLTAGC